MEAKKWESKLADFFRSRRLYLKLTQRQLAEKIGVAPTTIAAYERGRCTGSAMKQGFLNQLAKTLQCQTEDIQNLLPIRKTRRNLTKCETQIGSFIRSKRIELGLTEEQLAEKLGSALGCEIPTDLVFEVKQLSKQPIYSEDLTQIKKILGTENRAVVDKKAYKVLRYLLEKEKDSYTLHLIKGDQSIELELFL